MSQAVASVGFTQETFESFLASRQEPAWLVDQRRAAWELYQALPLPSREEEEWRRTEIRGLRLDRFGFPLERPTVALSTQGVLTEGVELAGQTISHNSFAMRSELDERYARQGVIFGSLDELAGQHPELIQRYFLTSVDRGIDKFAALHAAAWSGGTLLYVPKGVTIEQPLYSHSSISEGGVDFGHMLVIADEDADVTLLSETSGGDQPGLHCGAIEIFVGPQARVRYVNLQNWGSGIWHFAHQKALVDRDASLQWTIGALGSRLAKVNQHVGLVGAGANAQVNGVMFTEGKQHLSYHTLQHHVAPSCKSDLLYKGGLQDESHVVWRGMIKVDERAQKTDAYQRDDNLMLSARSRADSIPGLEIEADDVRCTHGATAGRVDDEMIFYAQARGLTRNEAIRMIVAGFFQQVFDRITLESVRNALGDSIGRRIRHYH